MIFTNPAGAPELACDECGCRWFDRMTNSCYECGAPVSPEAMAEFSRAIEAFHSGGGERPAGATPAGPSRPPDPDRPA